MSLIPQDRFEVPADTAKLARKVFPKGNVYLSLRDALGPLYRDSQFADMFATRGQSGLSPAMLAMVTVMQYMENLSDRQVAVQVAARIDWKYALGLPLAYTGFESSVLSKFRSRLIAGGREQQLLDSLLTQAQQKGWLRAGGKQRTDATRVLGAVRRLNRLEMVAETLRNALNSLAMVAGDWLLAQVPPEWFVHYSDRIEEYRLPKQLTEREALAVRIGQDGYRLLQAVYSENAPGFLREVPAVETLRRVWVQQYYIQEGQVQQRKKGNLPPGELLIKSPHDVEVRYSHNNDAGWTGYRVHMTETCNEETPHLIINVETTPATTPDRNMTADIHTHLAEKALLPQVHLVDNGYTDANLLVTSRTDHQVELLGPLAPNSNWQARAQTGYALADFEIDWKAQQVTCPEGQVSKGWSESHDIYSKRVIHVRFARLDCLACRARPQCTRSKKHSRTLKLRPQAEHQALYAARAYQQTDEFKQRYRQRAGVEGTISQAVARSGLRRSRYIGLAKTHLQHVLTAVAVNLARIAAWLAEIPRAQTRISHFAALLPVAT